ncbi:MAG: thiolase domain-containing protein [Candidatus Heimdallarchaeota archaeon]
MKQEVAVIGVGHAKFGKRHDATLRELVHEAARPCFEDASLSPTDMDASVIGVCGDYFTGQGSPASLLSDYIGMSQKPTIRVESACATGTAALRTAWAQIKAGQHDLIAVIGVEQMTLVSSAQATEMMARGGDLRWEYPMGCTFPGFYAHYASAHMTEFGTTREQMSAVGVKNHYYGAKNPYAHLQKNVTLEEAMKSVLIAWPLNLYDCSLISDGAAAAILASAEKAKQITDTPIWITGVGSSSDTMLLSGRPNLFGLPSTTRASRTAFKMAGIGPENIDVAEVHDCFTIAEIMAYEDIGFCKKGEGGKLAEEKQTYHDGKIPVNVDGGLKSKGHPLGATGVSQCYSLVKQLRGEAPPDTQVADPEIGLSHNVGQHGQYVNVLIYQR